MNKDFTSKTSGTDWEYLDAMSDNDIDFSDNPEVGADMFARGVVRKGLNPLLSSEKITIRLEKDIPFTRCPPKSPSTAPSSYHTLRLFAGLASG